MKEFIRYSSTVEISNQMIKDNVFIDDIKLECELKCYKSALKDSKTEFRLYERLFIDTTKEPDYIIISDDYLMDIYYTLKERGISRYIYTILAK